MKMRVTSTIRDDLDLGYLGCYLGSIKLIKLPPIFFPLEKVHTYIFSTCGIPYAHIKRDIVFFPFSHID